MTMYLPIRIHCCTQTHTTPNTNTMPTRPREETAEEQHRAKRKRAGDEVMRDLLLRLLVPACGDGHTSTVRRMLDDGTVDTNGTDERGNTAPLVSKATIPSCGCSSLTRVWMRTRRTTTEIPLSTTLVG